MPGRVIVVTGLCGSGKSRLIREASEALGSDGLRVFVVKWADSPWAKDALSLSALGPGERLKLFTHLWLAAQTAIASIKDRVDVVLVERWGFDIAFFNDPESLLTLREFERVRVDGVYVLTGGSPRCEEGVYPEACRGLGAPECMARLYNTVWTWFHLGDYRPVFGTGGGDLGSLLALASRVLGG